MYARATGATDKEARFEKLGAGRIGLGNGRGFVAGCRIQKGPHAAGFFDLVAGTGFEPVTFRL